MNRPDPVGILLSLAKDKRGSLSIEGRNHDYDCWRKTLPHFKALEHHKVSSYDLFYRLELEPGILSPVVNFSNPGFVDSYLSLMRHGVLDKNLLASANPDPASPDYIQSFKYGWLADLVSFVKYLAPDLHEALGAGSGGDVLVIDSHTTKGCRHTSYVDSLGNFYVICFWSKDYPFKLDPFCNYGIIYRPTGKVEVYVPLADGLSKYWTLTGMFSGADKMDYIVKTAFILIKSLAMHFLLNNNFIFDFVPELTQTQCLEILAGAVARANNPESFKVAPESNVDEGSITDFTDLISKRIRVIPTAWFTKDFRDNSGVDGPLLTFT